MTQEELFKKLIAHSKEYGFIFPSSEIYDGLSAVYDYGPMGIELKNNIIEAVERLMDDTDAVSAFHQLQNFHQQWREIGPVARELREEVWNRFKEASTAINRKYQ